MPVSRFHLAWPLLLLLGGCAHTVTHELPELPLESHWEEATQLTETGFAATEQDWWQAFESPELNQLVQQALAANPDFQTAWINLSQAELQLKGVKADRLPVTAGASIGGGTQYSSTTDRFESNESSSLNLQIGYEVDLWGRMAALRTASEASLQASHHDWQTARLSLSSNVASQWFQWLTLNNQITTAQKALALSEYQLQSLEAQFRQGSATRADLARQRSDVISKQNSLGNLEQEQQQNRRSLAILLGQSPQHWQPPQADLHQINIPVPHPGLPTELISRRPDLASAEARLLAAQANIQQARAALYPSLNLGISAALASDELLFADPTRTFSLTALLAQTLFDRGKRQRNIQLTEMERQKLVESYRASVLSALVEVENALGRITLTQTLENRQQQLITEQQTLVRQTESRHRLGADTLATLLDAQQSLATTENALIQQRQARLNASLELYKALGGGWSPTPAAE